MGNYTSCKILVKQIEGQLDLDIIKNHISTLKEANNIGETIKVYFDLQSKRFELLFNSKRFPSMISEIFKPDRFEIWIIGSDEGGASDFLKFYPSINIDINEITEKALYKFDEIELRGETQKIFENLEEIFGWGINYTRRFNRESFIDIKLCGIYKSNNYFNNEYDQRVEFNEVSKIPITEDFNNRTEFWEILWDVDGIEFRDKFYKEVLKIPDGKNNFEYLESIYFKYKGEVTNIFEWDRKGAVNYWAHKAKNSYNNLVNTNYLMSTIK